MNVVPGLLLTTTMVMVLTGCGAPVAVDPPPADEACQQLSTQLPNRVEGQERRPVTPDTAGTAAWGDPPVVLRCNVSLPDTYRPDSRLVSLGGVDWFPQELSNGVSFTSVNRSPAVEVIVPAAYAPEVNPLIDLAPVINSVLQQESVSASLPPPDAERR